VFMGDSITEGWGQHGAVPPPDRAAFFPGKPYVNRGISGQTTPQMLVRFRQDVIELKPKAVVVLAGTNDIAENTGKMTLGEIGNNIASMSELARANGIRVVLCSVLPASEFHWHKGLEPAPKVKALNAWIKEYAAKNGIVYVDYYSRMANNEGGLGPELSPDGVHPNKAGYEIMAPLAEAGIAEALKKPVWKVFSNRAGWSVKYPADWKIASCHSCSDPTAPDVYVDFFPPETSDSGWVMISHLGNKPPNATLDAWFSDIKQRANQNPRISEERLTLGDLPALKVRYRNPSGGGREMEHVYVVSGSQTFSISFGGEKPGLALEQYENYPIYLEMVKSFKVKP